MPKIVDPDNLVVGTNFILDTTAKTIELVVAGALSTDGVTGQAVVNKVKEIWRSDDTKRKFDIPFRDGTLTTDNFAELINGWNWKNTTTRKLLRDFGWLVRNSSNQVTEHWAGIRTTGDIDSDQAYYTVGSAPVNFTHVGLVNDAGQGIVNEAVQVISDPNGDGSYGDGFNYSTSLKVFCRIQGKTYTESILSNTGEVTLVKPRTYPYNLENATDINILGADTTIDANADNVADVAPYSGMSITWYATNQTRSIGGVNRSFKIIINGNNGTKKQIYTYVQWALRRSTDIDAGAGTKTGLLAERLLEFVGDKLKTKLTTDGGVFIDNYNTADINDLVFVDNSGVERTFPYTASGTIQFNNIFQADADTYYAMYFDAIGTANFGDSDAIVVNDASGTPIQGTLGGLASKSFTFDYDGNVQGGRTAGTDANIVLVALGKSSATYVKITGTIVRSTTNTFQLNASLDNNYSNP